MSTAGTWKWTCELATERDRESERREVVTVTDALDEKLGGKTSLYCSVCEEERTFVWTKWRGVEFYGYPPKEEYGWECTACGSKVQMP